MSVVLLKTYGFKVHVLVTLSGYILNYVVTSASVHEAFIGLLENFHQSYILADLGCLRTCIHTIISPLK